MLVLACLLVVLLSVPLTGGRLSRLAGLRWRRGWLLPLALAVQVVVLELPGVSEPVRAAAHVGTYGVAALFVWANRRVAGLWLLALGAACNGVTLTLNGGTLPASPRAMAAAGIEPEEGFVNSGVVADPVLGWLGDVFAVPQPVPLANVFSVGDVLIVAGAAWVLHVAARRLPGRSRPVVDAPLPAPRHATARVRRPGLRDGVLAPERSLIGG